MPNRLSLRTAEAMQPVPGSVVSTGKLEPKTLNNVVDDGTVHKTEGRIFMRKIVAVLIFAAMLLPIAAIAADWQPARPVEFVVASGAGGGTDIFARTVQSIVIKHKLMTQSIVVLNKGGGSGAEGFVYVKSAHGRSPQDGVRHQQRVDAAAGRQGRLEVRRADPRRRHGLRRVPALDPAQRPLEDARPSTSPTPRSGPARCGWAGASRRTRMRP